MFPGYPPPNAVGDGVGSVGVGVIGVIEGVMVNGSVGV